MSDRRLIYLSGEPGTGKSTLMARLTAGWRRYPQPPDRDAPRRDLLTATGRGVVAVELGAQRDAFGGTDALPAGVIGVACRYLSRHPLEAEAPLVLAEGARLANRRFLHHATAEGWQVTLVHLFGQQLAAHRRRQRAEQLGRREQDERWIKGRQTGARNLANAAPGWGVEVLALNIEDSGHELAVTRLIDDVHGWAR